MSRHWNHKGHKDHKGFVAFVCFVVVMSMFVLVVHAQRGGRGAGAVQGPAATGQSVAPIDLTGYWVSLVTDNWTYRVITPPKGDYLYLPLNAEARRVADTWDLAKDDAAGNQCKAYGVGSISRQPGRLHITWQDDNTLKLEYDAGTQTRMLHFGQEKLAGERTWQGYSVAEWDLPAAGGRGGGGNAVGAGGAQGRASITGRPGALKVVTQSMKEGYLRKNGVPYSASTLLMEYYDRFTEANSDDSLGGSRSLLGGSRSLRKTIGR